MLQVLDRKDFMTADNFCYWLKGFFEIDEHSGVKKTRYELTHQQIVMIKQHLDYVFMKPPTITTSTTVPWTTENLGTVTTASIPGGDNFIC